MRAVRRPVRWSVSRAWTLNGYRYPLPVTVTRGTRPVISISVCGPKAKSTGKKIGEFRERWRRLHTIPDANEKRLSSRHTQICGLPRICTCAVHYAAFYCDIFSLPAVVLSRRQSGANVLSSGYRLRGERDRVKLVSTSCGSFLVQDRICMETNRLLLRPPSERVSWCKLQDYIIILIKSVYGLF